MHARAATERWVERAMVGEMRAIKGRMADIDRMMETLPALGTEVRAMGGQLAVMAAGVDWTMGRMGRTLPGNWCRRRC
jgi:hypothetical protein